MTKILRLNTQSNHEWEIISEREFQSKSHSRWSGDHSQKRLRDLGWDVFGPNENSINDVIYGGKQANPWGFEHRRDNIFLVWDDEIINIEMVYKCVSKLNYYVSILPLIESYIRDQKINGITQ